MTELEEMMPEQSQAAAMGATLEEREVKAMRGSKQLPSRGRQSGIGPAIWYTGRE